MSVGDDETGALARHLARECAGKLDEMMRRAILGPALADRAVAARPDVDHLIDSVNYTLAPPPEDFAALTIEKIVSLKEAITPLAYGRREDWDEVLAIEEDACRADPPHAWRARPFASARFTESEWPSPRSIVWMAAPGLPGEPPPSPIITILTLPGYVGVDGVRSGQPDDPQRRP